MTINTASVVPRPDLPLLVAEDMPDLAMGFIAHEVLPILRVAVSTAPVPKALRGAMSTIARAKRAKYGGYATIQNSISTDQTFNCEDNGVEIPMDAKDVELFGGPDRADLMFGAQAMRMALLVAEAAASSLLFSVSTFGAGYNTAGAAAWDNANGKPIDDIAKAKENVLKRCGMEANTIAMGYGAYTALQQNAQIQSAVRNILGINNAQATRVDIPAEILALVFGVEKVLIGKAYYNSANEGLTATPTAVWGDAYCLVFRRDASAAGLMPGLGRTFVWDQGLMGNASNDVEDMPSALAHLILEKVGTTDNYDKMRARTYQDALVLNKEAGHLLTGL